MSLWIGSSKEPVLGFWPGPGDPSLDLKSSVSVMTLAPTGKPWGWGTTFSKPWVISSIISPQAFQVHALKCRRPSGLLGMGQEASYPGQHKTNVLPIEGAVAAPEHGKVTVGYSWPGLPVEEIADRCFQSCCWFPE